MPRLIRTEFLGPVGPIENRPADLPLLPATPHDRLDLLCRTLRAGRFREAQALAVRMSKPIPKGSTIVRGWFDGSCQRGYGSCGALVKRDGITMFSTSRYIGCGPEINSAVAEFAAAIAALRYLLTEG